MGIVSLLCCIVCCAVSGCCAAVTRRTEQQRTALEPIPERVCHSATPPIVTSPSHACQASDPTPPFYGLMRSYGLSRVIDLFWPHPGTFTGTRPTSPFE